MTLEAQVQWLIDRAAISELLFRFARALDTRDFGAYVELYAQDGTLELPDPQTGGTFTLRRDQMLDAVPKSLVRYTATHHLSTNHQIEVTGDRASSRSYLQAVHVRSNPREHWSAGGWYDCEYRRSESGWKFVRVRLTAVWLSGEPGAIRPEP
jgi:SnoaL-like domain